MAEIKGKWEHRRGARLVRKGLSLKLRDTDRVVQKLKRKPVLIWKTRKRLPLSLSGEEGVNLLFGGGGDPAFSKPW